MQTSHSTSAPRADMPFATDAERYEAVRARDRRAEGHFVYAVLTTGVYCRPACGARCALRANVVFHASPADAERAGFRACKRCRPGEAAPHERDREVVASARALLESAQSAPRLAALAAATGRSVYAIHRLFKQHLGMTPREYAAAHRLQHVQAELRAGAPVTAAIYRAGYSSSSRFYEAESAALGVPPAALRHGARGVEMRAGVFACSLGHALIAATARGVCAIFFGEAPDALQRDLRERFPHANVLPADAAFEALAARVLQQIDAAQPALDVPLDLIGTAFQQRVWRALRAIPAGQTTSYAELARALGAPRAARAVGSACGQNPVAVLVPCHRVLRGDGELGGYRWGLPRKRSLLARERAR